MAAGGAAGTASRRSAQQSRAHLVAMAMSSAATVATAAPAEWPTQYTFHLQSSLTHAPTTPTTVSRTDCHACSHFRRALHCGAPSASPLASGGCVATGALRVATGVPACGAAKHPHEAELLSRSSPLEIWKATTTCMPQSESELPKKKKTVLLAREEHSFQSGVAFSRALGAWGVHLRGRSWHGMMDAAAGWQPSRGKCMKPVVTGGPKISAAASLTNALRWSGRQVRVPHLKGHFKGLLRVLSNTNRSTLMLTAPLAHGSLTHLAQLPVPLHHHLRAASGVVHPRHCLRAMQELPREHVREALPCMHRALPRLAAAMHHWLQPGSVLGPIDI